MTKWQNEIRWGLEALNERTIKTKGIDALVDVLVTAFDLVAVVDDAGAVGGEGGDEQGDAGADVGRGHANATQGMGFVEADDIGTVRVAEDDLRTHVDELVHKEQAALEHLLVDEHGAFGLGGHHQNDTDQVGASLQCSTQTWKYNACLLRCFTTAVF